MKLSLNDLPCLVVGRQIQIIKEKSKMMKKNMISVIDSMENNYEELVVVKYGGQRNLVFFGYKTRFDFSYDITRGVYKGCLEDKYIFVQIVKIIMPIPKFSNLDDLDISQEILVAECNRLGISHENENSKCLFHLIKNYWNSYFKRSERYQVEGVPILIKPEKTMYTGMIYYKKNQMM